MIFVSASVSKTEVGVWKTIDDDSGKAKSHVKIFIKDGKLYGNIIKLYREKGEEQNPLCTECKGSKKDKPIIGMQIISGLEKDGNEWYKDDGILDPSDGKVYDCKLWLDENDSDILNVRGYIGWIYKTQNWHRVK
jgi:uncharacterized protein (DUF2147 family)